MNRKYLVTAVILFVVFAVVGCGGGNDSTPPPPPPPVLTVAISTAPPANLAVNATAPVAATVTNDAANGGVDWSCTPVGACGTFSAAHTASATATTYTAPAVAGNVTIVATSTTTNTKTASANVTIGAAAPAPSLTGTFVFFARGTEANARVFSIAGAVTLTAAGVVTAGIQDFNDGTTGNKSPVGGDTITGGAYTLAADGRGTLTLITNNANLGVAGTETFSIVKVNDKHVLIEHFDASATSSGSMDLQATTAGLGALTGAYAFAVVGKFATSIEGFGGVLNFNGSGGVSTNVDVNTAGSATRGHTSTGTYTAADATFGRGSIAFGGNTFIYYTVLSENGRNTLIRLLVTNTNETDLGTAVLQADNPTTFNASMITGKYVFVESGNHGNTDGFGAAGQFTADGAGTVTSGAADESEGGTPNDTTTGAVTGSYLLPANGVGTLTIAWTTDSHTRGMYPTDPDINLLDPNNPTGGGGALLLTLDAHVGDGVMVPQGATALPSGSFGLRVQTYNNSGETDIVGQVAVASGAITGLADVNSLAPSNLVAGAAVAGTLTADGANPGRFTVPLTLAGTSPESIVVYQISANQSVLVRTDATQFATGVAEKQQ